MGKTCKGCGETKPLEEFHRNSTSAQGRRARCKVCIAAQNATPEAKARRNKRLNEARKDPETRKRHSEYVSGWRKKSRIRLREQARERYQGDEDTRLKQRARVAVQYAVKRGKLKRPARCSDCQKACVPHGHHHSYEKRHWLDVEWLCQTCHAQHHSKGSP